MTTANPIVLSKFRAALDALYVFLKDLADRWAEADKIAVITTDVLDETDEVIHAMPYRAGSYRERTPLMHELRREGRDL